MLPSFSHIFQAVRSLRCMLSVVTLSCNIVIRLPEVFARSFVLISHEKRSSGDVHPEETIVDHDSCSEDHLPVKACGWFPLEGDDEHAGRSSTVGHRVLSSTLAVEVPRFAQVRVVLQVWNVPAPCLIALLCNRLLKASVVSIFRCLPDSALRRKPLKARLLLKVTLSGKEGSVNWSINATSRHEV